MPTRRGLHCSILNSIIIINPCFISGWFFFYSVTRITTRIFRWYCWYNLFIFFKLQLILELTLSHKSHTNVFICFRIFVQQTLVITYHINNKAFWFLEQHTNRIFKIRSNILYCSFIFTRSIIYESSSAFRLLRTFGSRSPFISNISTEWSISLLSLS